jgi:hypothetical protein
MQSDSIYLPTIAVWSTLDHEDTILRRRRMAMMPSSIAAFQASAEEQRKNAGSGRMIRVVTSVERSFERPVMLEIAKRTVGSILSEHSASFRNPSTDTSFLQRQPMTLSVRWITEIQDNKDKSI